MDPESPANGNAELADSDRERELIERGRTWSALWRQTPGAAPADNPSQPMPEMAGPYRLRRLIATGGMAAVYEAEHTVSRHIAAIKVLKLGAGGQSAQRRFQLEARVLARLQHPGIAAIYDFGPLSETDGPCQYLAMEYIDGERLTDYAALHDLSTADRLKLIVLVCEALQHAHDRGIIHRDLKPANILVDMRGQPKILDFGIARSVAADMTTVTQQTQWGQAIGTIPYMSPEQAAGQLAEIDSRSDVYSVGVVAYELVTGSLPLSLRGKSVPAALRTICEDSPEPPGRLDPSLRGSLESILLKALEKRVADRYQSVTELAADIRRFLAGERVETAHHRSRFRALAAFGRRWKWLLVLVVGSVALACIATQFPWRTSQEPAGPAKVRNPGPPLQPPQTAAAGDLKRTSADDSAQTKSTAPELLIALDAFDYPPGSLQGLGQEDNGWQDHWTGATQTVGQPGLTYIDRDGQRLATVGAAVRTAYGSASFRQFDLTLALQAGLVDPASGMLGRAQTSLWISLLAECLEPAPSDPVLWANCALFTGTDADGADSLAFGKNADAPYVWALSGLVLPQRLLTTIPTTESVFAVIRLQFAQGQNRLTLWLNPALDTEPVAADAQIDCEIRPLHFDRMRLGGSDLFRFDEIRIATTYRLVAPRAAGPATP
ncbi:MAG: serine/threonine protein kinase [Planctomycetes bacterium]|nr:serine/threonine protein kinase [Planctomycetota bacterium]